MLTLKVTYPSYCFNLFNLLTVVESFEELKALDKVEYKAYERDEEAELLVKMSEQAKVLAHEFQTLLFNINASMEKI